MDHTIRLWDGRTGKPRKILADPGVAIGWLSFSPDGKKLLSTDLDLTGQHSSAHLWSVPDGKELLTYQGHDNAIGLIGAISPDGRVAATAGGDDSNIDLWSTESGKLLKRLSGTGSAMERVGFSADGSAIVWSTSAQVDKLSRSTREFQRMRLPQQAFDQMGEPRRIVGELDSANQGERLTQGQKTLRTRQGGPLNLDRAILELVDGNEVKWAIERGPVQGFFHGGITLTLDGQSVISGGANGRLVVYDEAGNEIGNFVGHSGVIKSLAVSPDGKLLLSGSNDQTVKLWNLQTFECLLTIFYDKEDRWVAWTPSGHYRVAG